jgi:hypothetical protein
MIAERSREMQRLEQRRAAEALDRQERDELATKAWNAIDNADHELTHIRDVSSGAVEEALKREGHVKANLKTLTCAQVLDWTTFKAQTEQAIVALDDAVRKALTSAEAEPPRMAPVKAKTATRGD